MKKFACAVAAVALIAPVSTKLECHLISYLQYYRKPKPLLATNPVTTTPAGPPRELDA